MLNKERVQMERLELSQPKLLEPKPSASTNSATPAKFYKGSFGNKSLKIFKDLFFIFFHIHTIYKTC